MKSELLSPVADSYHMIVSYLYEFLLRLNRYYAKMFNLPLRLPLNNYASQVQGTVGEKYPSTHSDKRLCLDDGHQQDCP